MPRWRHGVVCLLVLASLLLAGCAGADSKSDGPGTASVPPPSEAARPTLDQGVIAGRVVDDELVAVPGANVALLESGNQTTSAADGSFSFPPLAPGKYSLVVEKLGYQSAAKKVEVRPDETVNVSVTLVPIVVGEEPFYLTVPKTAHIKIGNVFVDDGTQALNHSAINPLFCEPCRFPIHYRKGNVAEVYVQAIWSSTAPAVNGDIWLYYQSPWTTGLYLGGGTNIHSTYYSNREGNRFSETSTKTVSSADKILLGVQSGTTVNYEHKPTIYTTFSWFGPLPDDFTALPPA